MRNFQKKRVWSAIFQSKPILIILSIVILFFAWSVLGFWNKKEETSKNKKLAEDKVATLQKQKQDLSSQINNLKTDQGKEKIFRENYGLAKEGEGEIVIMDEKTSPAPPATNSGGFFSFLFFWKNWFK